MHQLYEQQPALEDDVYAVLLPLLVVLCRTLLRHAQRHALLACIDNSGVEGTLLAPFQC